MHLQMDFIVFCIYTYLYGYRRSIWKISRQWTLGHGFVPVSGNGGEVLVSGTSELW